LSSTANSVFGGSPNSNLPQDNQTVARKLIDRIFDCEVKRDALVKASRQYQVRVDQALILKIDH
jgi:hypothetical protein